MDLPFTYVPDFMTPVGASAIYKILNNDLDWVRRDGAPRSEYWTNPFSRSYTYGNGMGERTYVSQPSHRLIEDIKSSINEISVELEGCFLNHYLTGTDALGWHADDDPAIDHSRPIAVVSLYPSEKSRGRVIGVREKPYVDGGKVVKPPITLIELAPGSLLLMHPGMQATHLHYIPRASFVADARMSLTYRGLFR
jgi:alkylated DNA repair dioxygenase AlkB